MGHKLDPYKGIIEERLEEYPRLSAKRLYDEVRAAGYTGGYVRVRDYVRARRPRKPFSFRLLLGHQRQPRRLLPLEFLNGLLDSQIALCRRRVG